MTTQQRRQEILQAMNAITRMERGKLCTQSRGPGAPAFHKLQCWHQGKNHTRYVPAQAVAALQEALAGHEQFQQLAQEFANLTMAMTRQENVEWKKTPEIQAERHRETEAFLRLFGQRLQQGQAGSAGWIENTLRVALLEDGRRLLEHLPAQVPVPEGAPQPGQRRQRHRECEVFSMFGPVRRCRYHQSPLRSALRGRMGLPMAPVTFARPLIHTPVTFLQRTRKAARSRFSQRLGRVGLAAVSGIKARLW